MLPPHPSCYLQISSCHTPCHGTHAVPALASMQLAEPASLPLLSSPVARCASLPQPCRHRALLCTPRRPIPVAAAHFRDVSALSKQPSRQSHRCHVPSSSYPPRRLHLPQRHRHRASMPTVPLHRRALPSSPYHIATARRCLVPAAGSGVSLPHHRPPSYLTPPPPKCTPPPCYRS